MDRESSPRLRRSPPSSINHCMDRSDTQVRNLEEADASQTYSNTAESRMAERTAAQDAPSFLSRYPKVAGATGTTSSRPTPVDQPRKYRINKKSSHTINSSWQSEDESLLDQVLEQERLAWLTGSPTLGKEVLGDSDEHGGRTNINFIDHEEHAKVDASQSNEVNLSSSSRTELPRRSFFMEGSMNEGSKAVASTWHNTQASSIRTNDVDSGNESEATPRPSIAGSTSSSIDINEFKPLPATPSTFKTTIKRFGQKLKQKDPGRLPVTDLMIADSFPNQSRQQQRKGLRISVSSWKIFSGATSDTESKASSIAEEDDNHSVKTNNTARTLRSMVRKPRAQTNTSQKAVLDDRKRKAEIAYAEQFGATNKKQKQKVPSTDSSSISAQPTTVRRRVPSKVAAVTTAHSIIRPANQGSGFDSQSYSLSQHEAPVADFSVTEPLPQFSHSRTSSRNSDRSLNSDTDRSKRSSRSELEKENQQLRSMLRESQSQAHIRQAVRQSYKPHSFRSAQLSDQQEKRRRPSSSSNWQIHEDSCSSADEKQYRGQSVSSRRSKSRSPSRDTKSPLERAQQENGRPAPSASSSQKIDLGRTILSAVSGNPQPSYDTATMKQRGNTARPQRTIELPRPLSMVLEGVEDDNGCDSGENMGNESTRSSSKRKARASYDGTTDGEEDDRKQKKFSTMVSRAGETGSKETQWQWPEDVF
ncbi:hypothetical protein PMZ80_009660 [Knufia obscura]|uniref:Uncharacterized protein n=1 Tax=Knufia obscura TaxID=1635080 RepID=A0ABR0RBQ1_9EURO|nr:hypothetical protein PMZ80_009660 [Knufia obscura]